MTRYRQGRSGEIYKFENDIAYEYSFAKSKWVRTTAAEDAFYEGEWSLEITYEEAMIAIGKEYA